MWRMQFLTERMRPSRLKKWWRPPNMNCSGCARLILAMLSGWWPARSRPQAQPTLCDFMWSRNLAHLNGGRSGESRHSRQEKRNDATHRETNLIDDVIASIIFFTIGMRLWESCHRKFCRLQYSNRWTAPKRKLSKLFGA